MCEPDSGLFLGHFLRLSRYFLYVILKGKLSKVGAVPVGSFGTQESPSSISPRCYVTSMFGPPEAPRSEAIDISIKL
jgi:hypothetical protein